MNEMEERMSGKEAVALAKALVKWLNEETKKSKELLDLVCYMRTVLDGCSYGDGSQIDFGHKKLVRAFDIMMEVQHQKDLAKEKRNQANDLTEEW